MRHLRTGNAKPLISISKLKELYKSSKERKQTIIANIRSKLNIAIVTEISDSSDFTDAIDHDYALPIVRDCLICFLTGQVCKKVSQFRKCKVCRSSGFFYFEEETTGNYSFARIIAFD